MPILLLILIGITSLNILYYLFFSKVFFTKKSSGNTKNHLPVSILVCAKNEAENLETITELLLKQQYDTFEILLINDASMDHTSEIIEKLELKNDRINSITIKNVENFWRNKKYSLTLAIKKARYDHLLFIGPRLRPTSEFWLSEMSASFTNEKQLILGYGSYETTPNSLTNKLIRCRNSQKALLFFGAGLQGFPFDGNGKNVGYTKELFYKNNGFSTQMKLPTGAARHFINRVASKKNTALQLSKNTFVKSTKKYGFFSWIKAIKNDLLTMRSFGWKSKFFISIFHVSQLLFWVCGISCIVLFYSNPIVWGIVGFRFLIYGIVFGSFIKKIHEKGIWYLLPLLEVLLLLIQLTTTTSHFLSKKKK